MKKKRLKLLTLILAGTLLASMSLTAFAANENANAEESCCTTDDGGVTTCAHNGDECDMEGCTLHPGTNTRTDDTENSQKTENKCICSEKDCDCTECSMNCGDLDCNTCKGCESGCGSKNKTENKDESSADKDKTDKTDENETDTNKDKTSETVSGNSVENKDDVNTGKAGSDKGAEKDDSKNETLNADVVKDDAETVKTGEASMVPVIIGLAMVAAGAGAGFVAYRKRKA